MSLIETLQQNVEQIRQAIAACRQRERQAIAEINNISADDVRGQTPEVSERVKSLEKERRTFAANRRQLQAELPVAVAVLEKACSITK